MDCSLAGFPVLHCLPKSAQGRIMPLKYIHDLIAGINEYVTSPGKRDFADVIRVKDPEMERLPWIIQVKPI